MRYTYESVKVSGWDSSTQRNGVLKQEIRDRYTLSRRVLRVRGLKPDLVDHFTFVKP